MSPTDPRIDDYFDRYVEGHPGTETLHDYRDGILAKDEHSLIAEHLTHCAACCAQLQTIEQEISAVSADTVLRDSLWSRITECIHEAKSHASSTSGTLAIPQLQSLGKTVAHAEGSPLFSVFVPELSVGLENKENPVQTGSRPPPRPAASAYLPWEPEVTRPSPSMKLAAKGKEMLPMVAKFDVPGQDCYIEISSENGHAWLTAFGTDSNRTLKLDRWRVFAWGACVAEFVEKRANCRESVLFGGFDLIAPDGTTQKIILQQETVNV